MKILIIEDEEGISDSISKYFENQNYRCEVANNFQLAMEKISSFEYDCILLDITLPDDNGLRVLEELKKGNRRDGVIIVSARNSLDDKIKGLEIGADDYLTKPFHLAELAARVYAVIRRREFDNANILKEDDLEIDLAARTVLVNGKSIELTKKEFDLLLLFIGNKNRVLSKNTLSEHLSGDFADELDNQDVIYAHIKNLKRKLRVAGAQPYIKTVYGTGYKWYEG